MLDGEETWYYADGSKQYEAIHKLGRKVDAETLYRAGGSRCWQWEHLADGTSVRTQWFSAGTKKAESVWKDFHAHGPAQNWDRAGQPVSSVIFQKGRMTR